MSHVKPIEILISQIDSFNIAMENAIMRVNDFINYRKHAQGRNFTTRLKNAGKRRLL